MLQILSESSTVHSKSNMLNTDNDIMPFSIVVCSDGNLSCDLQGEAVVLNLQSGTYFGLNPMGARIWELIQKPAKVSDVLHELLEEYEVDASLCEADLVSFLNQLREQNLLKICSAEG